MTNTHETPDSTPSTPDDAPEVEYREINVDAEDPMSMVSALMDVIEEEGMRLDREQLSEKGFSWLCNQDGSKSALVLMDGFTLATVPVGKGTSVKAPHAQPVLLTRTEGTVDEDSVASHIDTAAQARGSSLVMRSKDAALALAIGEKDGATLCVPVEFLIYEGVAVAVVAGEVFATRTDFRATSEKAIADLRAAAAAD